LNLTVKYFSALIFRSIVSVLDPLDTERAFFHDPFEAHSDVGIQLQIERLRPLPQEPVKSSYFVGTILGAEASADTAIVNLVIQAFL
jgi:hypothetical protein